MRTFIAIELPDAVRDALADLSSRLRKSGLRASWVRPDRMHLTLRFLGEVDIGQADRLRALLAHAYQPFEPFSLHVGRVGAFPNPRKPAILWAGVDPLEGSLSQVQAMAEESARSIGIPPETKPFHPHLTLARVKDRRNAPKLLPYIEREQDFDGGSFSVRSVALFSSRLTPKGPIYQRLQEFPFSWTSSPSAPYTVS